MEDGTGAPALVPRLCHIVRWPDFNGYGFNLHAEKGKAGQFIGKVDPGSPAEAAGLREGDRIVEVNGINIGNENHQQVVSRIKSGGTETRLLVVDTATDLHYKSSMTVVRGDLPEVRFLTALREPTVNSTADTNGNVPAASTAAEPPAEVNPRYPVRLCKLRKWSDFDGYGFNLHAERDKPGQFIGAVDPDSPAEVGGLRQGDRIVEVNGDNIEALSHAGVIQKVKAGGERVELLVLDREADAYYYHGGGGAGTAAAVSGGMRGVTVIVTPPTSSSGKAGGPVSYGMNGGTEIPEPQPLPAEPEPEPLPLPPAEPEPEPEPEPAPYYRPEPEPTPMPVARVPEPEPEPAVIRSTVTSSAPSPAVDGGLNLHLSAAEMKERLKARKKQDPRFHKTSFEAKSKMFEKL
ncbi:Na(+)/H(+) exchange regulatory cofactor NHE-RF2-like isoform X2 [Babylonia areolata]|uniref:Na(+)/H(+) exchange regulatory cofactor NHE-RF2-like isoform X2 n=1 Tax=Babylonia areolata TaxID=304850 RepID=UPI003FD070E8